MLSPFCRSACDSADRLDHRERLQPQLGALNKRAIETALLTDQPVTLASPDSPPLADLRSSTSLTPILKSPMNTDLLARDARAPSS